MKDYLFPESQVFPVLGLFIYFGGAPPLGAFCKRALARCSSESLQVS